VASRRRRNEAVDTREEPVVPNTAVVVVAPRPRLMVAVVTVVAVVPVAAVAVPVAAVAAAAAATAALRLLFPEKLYQRWYQRWHSSLPGDPWAPLFVVVADHPRLWWSPRPRAPKLRGLMSRMREAPLEHLAHVARRNPACRCRCGRGGEKGVLVLLDVHTHSL